MSKIEIYLCDVDKKEIERDVVTVIYDPEFAGNKFTFHLCPTHAEELKMKYLK